jgi:hypothetical protein
MEDRQAAGKDFLVYLINNRSERNAAIANPAYARQLFQEKGAMTLPPEVEILPMRNQRPDRDNFNIILVPDEDPDPNILTYWIAAWVPYGEGDIQANPQENNKALKTMSPQ